MNSHNTNFDQVLYAGKTLACNLKAGVKTIVRGSSSIMHKSRRKKVTRVECMVSGVWGYDD